MAVFGGRLYRARVSILRPLAARDDARFRECNHTSHSSLTRRLHLTIRASRRPRRRGLDRSAQKTPQSPRARSVVTTARARRPSSCRAKRARGNQCRMPIAGRARRRGWYARTPDDDETFAMCPFNGKFQIRATRTRERAMETIARRREADEDVVVMSFVRSMVSSRVSARWTTRETA